jgi:hypothetical protein
VLAQVLLKIGNPSGEVPAQAAFGKEPEARLGMLANPLRTDDLPHIAAATEQGEGPPYDCQHIRQSVIQLVPSKPVRIPVSH